MPTTGTLPPPATPSPLILLYPSCAEEEVPAAVAESGVAAATECEELTPVGDDGELQPIVSSRSSTGKASSEGPSFDISDEKENAVDEAMLEALSAKVKGNEMALMANEAVIRALRQALAAS